MMSWHLERVLRQEIPARFDAVRILTRTLLRVLAVPPRPPRPAGILLLLGPAGSGKNDLIRAITRAVGQDPERLPRVNCAIFLQSAHFLSYLQHVSVERAGRATAGGPGRPDVVVIENIDQASGPVLDTLIHVFEHGRMTAGPGLVIDFSNCLFLLKCAITDREADQLTHGAIGFAGREQVRKSGARVVVQKSQLEQVSDSLSARLLACIDEVVVLRKLEVSDLPPILDRILTEAAQRLYTRGVELVVEPAARQLLLERGAEDLPTGARALRRAVEELVETPVWDLLTSLPVARPMRVFVKRSFHRMTFLVPNLLSPLDPLGRTGPASGSPATRPSPRDGSRPDGPTDGGLRILIF